MLKLLLSVTCVFFSSQSLWAQTVLAENAKFYYGKNPVLKSPEEFKQNLHKIISSFHISSPSDFDRIVRTCSKEADDNCYTHIRHGYKKARQYMFGSLYLRQDSENNYYVTSVYCEKDISDSDFPKNKSLGPMKVPDAHILNTEHAWPQSHFSNDFQKSLQKSDLHALYPVQMKVNSTRGNYPFGEVVSVINLACDKAALGRDENNQMVFEPSEKIKGNIARSLFYFSIRYNMSLQASQENVLRRWHQLDPVDQNERDLHEEIFEIQHVRNPFIDNPQWVEKIENF